MKNVLELLYDASVNWGGGMHPQDSPFVKTARIANQNMELLQESLSEEQKEWLDAYFDADTILQGMINADQFRYAFHLGAQLMAEIIAGKEELLK